LVGSQPAFRYVSVVKGTQIVLMISPDAAKFSSHDALHDLIAKWASSDEISSDDYLINTALFEFIEDGIERKGVSVDICDDSNFRQRLDPEIGFPGLRVVIELNAVFTEWPPLRFLGF
jgi:hypothetical protein